MPLSIRKLNRCSSEPPAIWPTGFVAWRTTLGVLPGYGRSIWCKSSIRFFGAAAVAVFYHVLLRTSDHRTSPHASRWPWRFQRPGGNSPPTSIATFPASFSFFLHYFWYPRARRPTLSFSVVFRHARCCYINWPVLCACFDPGALVERTQSDLPTENCCDSAILHHGSSDYRRLLFRAYIAQAGTFHLAPFLQWSLRIRRMPASLFPFGQI